MLCVFFAGWAAAGEPRRMAVRNASARRFMGKTPSGKVTVQRSWYEDMQVPASVGLHGDPQMRRLEAPRCSLRDFPAESQNFFDELVRSNGERFPNMEAVIVLPLWRSCSCQAASGPR